MPASLASNRLSQPLMVDLVGHDGQNAHLHSESQIAESSAALLTAPQAAKEVAVFWRYMLRHFVSLGSDAAKTFIIAQKDIELLAAYAAYRSVISLVTGLLYGAVYPLTSLIADEKSEEDRAAENNNNVLEQQSREKICLLWRQGLILTSTLSVLAIAFGLTASPIFSLTNQPEVVLKDSRKYLLFSTPGFLMDLGFRVEMRAVTALYKEARPTFMLNNAGFVLEAGLSYLLVNGKAGLPELGLPGVAVAYSISKFVILSLHTVYMYFSPACLGFDFKAYNLFSCNGIFFHKDTFKELLSKGLPSGLDNVLGNFSLMLMTLFCGQFGAPVLFALHLAGLFGNFANFHSNTVLNAAMKLVGPNLKALGKVLNGESSSANQMQMKMMYHEVKLYMKLLYALCVLVGAIACGLTFLIPRQIVTLLVDEQDSAHQVHLKTSIDFLKIQGVFELVKGMQTPAYSGLYGMGANAFLLWTTIIFDLAMGGGAAAGTRYGLKKGADWVFSSAGIGFVLMTLAQVCYLNKRIRKLDPAGFPAVALGEDGEVVSQPHVVSVLADSSNEPADLDSATADSMSTIREDDLEGESGLGGNPGSSNNHPVPVQEVSQSPSADSSVWKYLSSAVGWVGSIGSSISGVVLGPQTEPTSPVTRSDLDERLLAP